MNGLTLTIANLEQLQQSIAPSHQFSCRGGTIGSRGTDWILNDGTAQIQPLHCEIRWIEGSFCAVDQCGQTFLNGSQQSLGRVAPVRLQEGDYLRIGAYDLRIHCHPYQGTGYSKRRSLDELLTPGTCVLNALVRDPAEAGSPSQFTAPLPRTAFDICQMFDPAMGCDPLAALEGPTVLQQADASEVLQLLRGGRP